MSNQTTTQKINDPVRTWWKQTLARLLLTIVATGFAVFAAYLGTINELKLALAEKADRKATEQIDLRLARMEVFLNDHLLTKDEFFRLRDDLIVRLTRIESELDR